MMPLSKLVKFKPNLVSSTDGRVRRALGAQLFEAHWPRNIGTLILAAIMAGVLASGEGYTDVLTWFLVMSLLTFLRIALVVIYQKQDKEAQKSSRWEGRFILITGAIGIWWGWLVFCYYSLGNQDQQSVLIFCVAGLTTVSIPYLAYVRRAYLIFFIPILMSLNISFSITGEAEKIWMVG
ncbi:MAG: hypothetical protein JKY51_06955, partial [Opitutaceae bacterium]|nr:hypothetical protein [Opitutaceae bacterium]